MQLFFSTINFRTNTIGSIPVPGAYVKLISFLSNVPADLGTLSGVIKDSVGLHVSGADVILYSIMKV